MTFRQCIESVMGDINLCSIYHVPIRIVTFISYRVFNYISHKGVKSLKLLSQELLAASDETKPMESKPTALPLDESRPKNLAEFMEVWNLIRDSIKEWKNLVNFNAIIQRENMIRKVTLFPEENHGSQWWRVQRWNRSKNRPLESLGVTSGRFELYTGSEEWSVKNSKINSFHNYQCFSLKFTQNVGKTLKLKKNFITLRFDMP